MEQQTTIPFIHLKTLLDPIHSMLMFGMRQVMDVDNNTSIDNLVMMYNASK
jgi:hypothetical protein